MLVSMALRSPGGSVTSSSEHRSYPAERAVWRTGSVAVSLWRFTLSFAFLQMPSTVEPSDASGEGDVTVTIFHPCVYLFRNLLYFKQ